MTRFRRYIMLAGLLGLLLATGPARILCQGWQVLANVTDDRDRFAKPVPATDNGGESTRSDP